MAYVLRLDEPLPHGIRRVGISQIDKAIKELRGKGEITAGIHNARKCFKRLRALLDLARPTLPAKTYRRENRRYRDLGRRFSSARDIQVMSEAIEGLRARHGEAAGDSVFCRLQDWLDSQRLTAEQQVQDSCLHEALAELKKGRKVFAKLALEDRGFATIGEGLADTYRAGRRACACALERNDDETFHECRKMIQRHWRHLQLVSLGWPEIIRPRVALASHLSRIIGDDHDLAVLVSFAQANGEILGDSKAAARFVDLCRKRQAELRAAAAPRCQRLYATPPKALITTLEAYWGSARDIDRTSPVIEDVPDTQRIIRLEEHKTGKAE